MIDGSLDISSWSHKIIEMEQMLVAARVDGWWKRVGWERKAAGRPPWVI